MKTLAALALALVLMTASPPVYAQSIIKRPFAGSRPMQLDVHAGFAWVGKGLATGARFGIPLLHNGFIKKINNAVYINFGLDLYFVKAKYKHEKDAYGLGFGIPVTLHWEFYFTPRWSAFGEAGPNIFLHPGLLKGHGWDWSPEHWFTVTAGGRFFLTEAITLTLRVGNPYSSFGVTFMF